MGLCSGLSFGVPSAFLGATSDIGTMGVVATVGGFIDWAQSHPWWVVGAFVVGAVLVCMLAGPAGPVPGGLLATLLYATLGGSLGVGMLYGASSLFNVRLGRPEGPPEQRMRLPISRVLIVYDPNTPTSLRVEMESEGGKEQEVWTPDSLLEEVCALASRTARDGRGERNLSLAFKGVPQPLQDTILEELRVHDVNVRIEEPVGKH